MLKRNVSNRQNVTAKQVQKVIDALQSEDLKLFGRVYAANQFNKAVKGDVKESLQADLDGRLQAVNFPLMQQPSTYVITLQVRAFYKLSNESIVTRHMTNLELTYGAETVESVIKNFFPNFYTRYYREAQ